MTCTLYNSYLISGHSCAFTDAETQLKDTTSASPLSSRDHPETDSTQTTPSTSSSSPLPPSPSAPTAMDNEAEPARYVGSAQGSAGGMLITAELIQCRNLSLHSFPTGQEVQHNTKSKSQQIMKSVTF